MRTHPSMIAVTLSAMIIACGARDRAPEPASPKVVVVPAAPPGPAESIPVAANDPAPVASAGYEPAPPPERFVEEETAPPPAPATPFASKCKGVTFTIKTKAVTQYGLEIEAELVNNGKSAITLMRTNDGSDSNMRNPTVSFALQPNKVAVRGRCGNVNGFDEKDIVTLAPGAHMPLEWLTPPGPSAAGRYKFRATYRNDPAASPIRGAGQPPSTSQLARVRATLACEVTSNELTFDWPAKGQPPTP